MSIYNGRGASSIVSPPLSGISTLFSFNIKPRVSIRPKLAYLYSGL